MKKDIFLKRYAGTALVARGEEISYSALMTRALHYSRSFDAQKTTKVAIFSENRAEWVYSLYAAWHAGAMVVPIDYMASSSEIAHILNDSQPEIVFCSQACLPNLKLALGKTDATVRTIVMDNLGLPDGELDEEFNNSADPERTALIVYTSGTTGNAKGVMLSFANLKFNIRAVSESCPIFHPDLSVMMMLPCHHILPLLGTIVAPLCVGCRVVICASLLPSEIMNTLKTYNVNMIVGVPRFYNLIYFGIKKKIDANSIARILFQIAQKIGSKRLSKLLFNKVHRRLGGCLESLISGGAALDMEVAKGLSTLGFNVLEGYGMTETAPMICFPRLNNVRLGSVGQPLTGCQVTLDRGEVIVRGENVMQGYYGLPEETKAMIDDEGWLHTGDLGRFDRDGFLYITGRKKELIVLPNGKNISPAEVEEKLMDRKTLLEDAAVFMDGNSLHALIYPSDSIRREKSSAEADAIIRSELIAPYNEASAPYKKIMKYTLVERELPRTRLGKLKRFELPQLARNPLRDRADMVEPDSPEYHRIKGHLQDMSEQKVMPGDHLEYDLALDSLQRVGLLAFLKESFGVDLDDTMLRKYPTVKELAEKMQAWKVKFNSKAIIDWTEILKEKSSFSLPRSTLVHSFVQRIFKAFVRSFFRLTAKGVENVPEGPCIIAPNHQSNFDSIFATAFLRTRRVKKIFFYAKKKHVNNRFLLAMAERCNVVVMDSEYELKNSIQKLAQALRNGQSILIFPEGTRSPSAELGEFKKTFAILSRELNIPIIPVAIKGASRALPRGSILPRIFRRIRVTYLPKVYPQGEDYDQLNAKIRRQIAAVLKE